MKKISFVSALMLAVLLPAASLIWADDAVTPASGQPTVSATPAPKAKTKAAKKKKATVKYVYVCPMGDFTGDKPGKCPNCGMDLVKTAVSDSKPVTNTK